MRICRLVHYESTELDCERTHLVGVLTVRPLTSVEAKQLADPESIKPYEMVEYVIIDKEHINWDGHVWKSTFVSTGYIKQQTYFIERLDA